MVPAFISVVRGSMREGSPTNKMNDGYRQNIMIESIKRFCFWAVLSFLVGGATTQCLCATPTRAGGSYVTRPKNVLGMNYLFEVRSNISHFMKVALDGKSFNKALQYKTDTKFIEALEDGLLADNQAIKAINEKPELVDEYYSFYTQTKGTLAEFLAKGGGNAFKVITTDIGTALRNRVGHIRKIVFEAKSNGTYCFSGCHSKSAIDELGANARIEITIPKNAEGVYEAKVFAKGPDGKEIVKSGNGGKSTFFPDHWDEAKILEEAEFAVKNNKGLIDPTDATKGYYGFSKDGKVKIGFYYRDTDGYIGSFFPILNP